MLGQVLLVLIAQGTLVLPPHLYPILTSKPPFIVCNITTHKYRQYGQTKIIRYNTNMDNKGRPLMAETQTPRVVITSPTPFWTSPTVLMTLYVSDSTLFNLRYSKLQ